MTYTPPPPLAHHWRDATPKNAPRCSCGQPLWAPSSRLLGQCARCIAPQHRVILYSGPPYLVAPDG